MRDSVLETVVLYGALSPVLGAHDPRAPLLLKGCGSRSLASHKHIREGRARLHLPRDDAPTSATPPPRAQRGCTALPGPPSPRAQSAAPSGDTARASLFLHSPSLIPDAGSRKGGRGAERSRQRTWAASGTQRRQKRMAICGGTES